MTRILLVLALAVMLSGCKFDANNNCYGCTLVIGSGAVKVEQRAVPSFNAIEHDTTGDVIITQGETEALSIESDDNVLPVLVSEVRNGVLHLSVESGKAYSVKTLVYRITVKNLDRLDLNGSSSAVLKGVTGQRLAVDLTGACSLEASGKINELRLSVTGAASIDARRLLVESAKVELTGAGSATLAVSKVLDANVTGAASLLYTGNPRVSSSVAGVGSVTRI